jgi:hypothetical protein
MSEQKLRVEGDTYTHTHGEREKQREERKDTYTYTDIERDRESAEFRNLRNLLQAIFSTKHSNLN